MEGSVKNGAYSLTVNESDVRLQFQKKVLHRVYLSSNKVLEMKGNHLLQANRLDKYKSIVLIKNHRSFTIPIIPKSGQYRGQQMNILSFDVLEDSKIMREDVSSFYVKKRMKRKKKEQPNEKV